MRSSFIFGFETPVGFEVEAVMLCFASIPFTARIYKNKGNKLMLNMTGELYVAYQTAANSF